MNTDNKTDWQNREVGALWKKQSATQKYFSGHVKIDDYGEEKLLKVVIFSNRHKTKDNHPDFRIYTVDTKNKQVNNDVVSNDTVSTDVVRNDSVETEEVL